MITPKMDNKTRISLQDVAFDAITETDACAQILRGISSGRGGFIVTANLDHLRRCRRSPVYRDLVARADLVVADGMPLVWASRLQGTPLPERVAGSTMCLSLAQQLAAHHRSVFLLGGNPGVAEQSAKRLLSWYPGLEIAGTHCPEYGFEKVPQQMDAIRESIERASPDIVYVALGSPKQEELIDRLRADFPKVWWMGVGISLSFIAGDVSRAPRWMQQWGMEWFHRMMQEPRRLSHRYLVDGIPFALDLFAESAWRRFSR